jgi:putative Mg2+ transporter-C (MgtC) family protein
MLTLQEMLIRLVAAIVLGSLIGFEREMVGKEAGIRAGMIVAAGACIFSLISLALPYIVAPQENINSLISTGSFFSVIANIVVGIGFLGAGIIIKTEEHVRGLTTAATVWLIAAIGVLVGIGLIKFAFLATVIMFLILFLFRNISIHNFLGDKK